MGFLFKGVCYPSQSLARQAECDTTNFSTVSGTTLTTSQCAGTTATWTAVTYPVCIRTNGGACTTRNVPFGLDQPCTFDSVTVDGDMLSLFYIGLGVFAALLSLRWIYNHFRPDRDDTK